MLQGRANVLSLSQRLSAAWAESRATADAHALNVRCRSLHPLAAFVDFISGIET